MAQIAEMSYKHECLPSNYKWYKWHSCRILFKGGKTGRTWSVQLLKCCRLWWWIQLAEVKTQNHCLWLYLWRFKPRQNPFVSMPVYFYYYCCCHFVLCCGCNCYELECGRITKLIFAFQEIWVIWPQDVIIWPWDVENDQNHKPNTKGRQTDEINNKGSHPRPSHKGPSDWVPPSTLNQH